MSREGVDYSWGRPDPAALRAAGITFACRYLSPDAGKNLSAGEARSLIAHGIDVVSNWEASSDRSLAGWAGGQADGNTAANQAAACGAPPGSAIYFSVDFDVQPSQYPTIRDYISGAREGLAGRFALGVYGSYACIDMLGSLIDYGWQTLAWSHGMVHPRAHIYQYAINRRIAGADVDLNRSLIEPFGAWGNVRPAPVLASDHLLLMS